LDAKEQNIKTCKDSLARYIEEKELFGKMRNVFKPLVFSTIRNYVNEIWNKMERKKKNQEGKR
jgi:ssDNA-specific exonuclease RecJ